MSQPADTFKAAVALHQSGQHEAAATIYRQILAENPRHADAHNLLGLIGWQTGQFAEAREHLLTAIALNASQAAYHANLGEAYRGLGEYGKAIESYREAVRLAPQAGTPLVHLGTLYELSGDVPQARQCYEQTLARDPRMVYAHFCLANLIAREGQWQAAEAQFAQALAVQPEHPMLLAGLGQLHKQQGQLDKAAEYLERAVEVDPRNASRRFDLANVYQLERRWDQAIAAYRAALDLDPQHSEAMCNLGNALREKGQLDVALLCLEQAVARAPQSAAAHSNLGATLQDLGRLDEAHQKFTRAVELEPERPELHHNLGTIVKDQGDVAGSIAHFDRALALQPSYGQASCSRGLTQLQLGNWNAGWGGYEHRVGLPQFDTWKLTQPVWRGEPLEGRTLLVHCEQGLGDTLQFIRYLKLVKEQAQSENVLVAAPAALIPLLHSSGISNLVAREAPLPAFDVHVPLLSLPLVFGTTMETVPDEIPYLMPEPERVARWRAELGQHEGFKIGIAWQGRKNYRGDRFRSIPLMEFAPLAAVPGVRLFSLQKYEGSEQLAALKGRFAVTDLASRLDGDAAFVDTAAAMHALDLVISSDTAIAHLAGGLGVRGWIALPRVADWRWMIDREDSPWYPTVRLFRQNRFGDWASVFERMAAEVATERAGT